MDTARPENHHGREAAVGGSAAEWLVYPTIFTQNEVAASLAAYAIGQEDLPVAQIQKFRNSTVVRKHPPEGFTSKGRPEGAVIRELSHQARMRYLHTAINCNATWRSLPCVTYPREFPRNGAAVKRDRMRLNQWFLYHFHGVIGMWMMEFQMRGAPHFHDLSDIDLASYGPLVKKRRRRPAKGAESDEYWTCEEMERDLAQAWYKIVGSGDERHLKAGVSWEVCQTVDGAIRYASQHAAKPHQKRVPVEYHNLGRFWGKYGPLQVIGEEPQAATTEDVFREFGPAAMSSRGKVKKHIWKGDRHEW